MSGSVRNELIFGKGRLKNRVIWLIIAISLIGVLRAQWTGGQPPVQLPREAVQLQNERSVPYDKKPDQAKQVSRPTPTFGSYPCSGSCQENKAGYRWAQQNGIVDPDSCTGKTSSFIEGCRVYAMQRGAHAWW